MQQSNFIFGMLLLAYFIFITNRRELSAYIALLRGSNTGTGSGAGNAASQLVNGLLPLPGLPSIGNGTFEPAGNSGSLDDVLNGIH